jgi:hypothetical protein
MKVHEEIKKAIEVGNLNAVKSLVEKGVDIHAEGEYLLTSTAYFGHLDIFKYLVEKGADVHVGEGAPLIIAAEQGKLNIVKYLIEKGVKAHKNTALKYAASKGHLDIVRLLVESGADIHTNNDEAFIWACRGGHVEVVKYLVEQGADVKVISVEDIALLKKYREILTVLWGRLPKEKLLPFLVSDSKKVREVAKEMLKEEGYGL